jgi:hypothetical protein
MRRFVGLLAIGFLLAGPAEAQGGRMGPPGRAGARAQMLRGQIEQAFGRRLRETLGLTGEQSARMQRVVSNYADRRQTLENEEQQLRQGLASQLRPGVAANGDSVSRLVSALGVNRVAYGESFRDEIRELTPILTPVQLGQFYLERDRLLQRIRDIQAQTRLGPGRGMGGLDSAPPERSPGH